MTYQTTRQSIRGAARATLFGLMSVCAAGASAADKGGAAPPAFSVGGEWGSYNKSLDGQRYSMLRQINTGNAAELAEVCRIRIEDHGSFQAGLIVIGDVMYATTITDTIALDPATCAVKWRRSYRADKRTPFPVNRGVAYYAGRLYRGTGDGRVIALDAATGAEVWSNVVGDPANGEIVSGAPLAWNGLVIVGTAVSEFGVRGRIIAYDADTGREVWRFYSVPLPGEPGSETWQNTVWNNGSGGGGTWSHFALDPGSAELFIPIGNPVPDFAPGDRPGANLYTNCVLVLDARTGKLKWWYQLAPNDGLDHDLASAPVLYRNSAHQAMVAAGGKDGYVHIVDRTTHKLVAKTAVTTVDKNPQQPTEEGVKACPGVSGGVEWNGPAFDPERNRLFVGALDYCSMFIRESGTKPRAGGANYGGSWSGIGTASGWFSALDADTGKVAWQYHADAAVLSGITPTAGGIVMGGDNAGNFFVFDSDNGKVLKSVATGGSLSGGVITYETRGKQYVAFTSGNVSRSLFGAVGRPSIVVMALPAAVLAKEAATQKADITHGRDLFFGLCGACHGADGKAWRPIDLTKVKNKMTEAELVAFIKKPRAPMPAPFPEPLNAQDERDIRDIAAFLMQWQ